MSDRPILFSAPMIRALLDGTKTQTRRVVNIGRSADDMPDYDCSGRLIEYQEGRHGIEFVHKKRGLWEPDKNPTGMSAWFWRIPIMTGDRLWVRESWSGEFYFSDTKPSERVSNCLDGYPHDRNDIWYWADGDPDSGDWERPRPSIHMPRWASRLTLTVTDVRVQRLQEISEADAIAEGIESYSGIDPDCGGYLNYANQSKDGWWLGPNNSFRTLWNSINGPDAWSESPWVAAYTFTVRKGNIDHD